VCAAFLWDWPTPRGDESTKSSLSGLVVRFVAPLCSAHAFRHAAVKTEDGMRGSTWDVVVNRARERENTGLDAGGGGKGAAQA
jgi:hypothetical protein